MTEERRFEPYDWKQRFSDTAELLPGIICEIDPGGYLTWVNRMGLERFKYTKEEFDAGLHLSRILHPEDLAAGLTNVKAIVEGRTVGPREYRMTHGDGSWAVYQVNSAPIIDGCAVVGIRTCLFDVSDRKRAEAQLRQSEARLAEAVEAEARANARLRDLEAEVRDRFSFEDMIGRSDRMRRIFHALTQVADTSSTVLVLGESGTGKELVARAIHRLSPRADRPFVAVNCGALPDVLLESELFGCKAGAFADAKRDKQGKLALAEGGVVFLDEIGDISTAMQVKLHRVLQERVYEPLGGTIPCAADVRVIAATNRDLPAMVKEGTFRDDLFCRLNVLEIRLPPLRERRSDIPLLCDRFIEVFNRRFGKAVREVAPEALAALLAWDFPGNIRELENIMEHAFVFCRGGRIELAHLPEELAGPREEAPAGAGLARFRSFEELEAHYLRAVLSETGGNRLEAARRLGIHKSTLFRKLKSLGISED
jgi:PAS domain S-box-containing protein